MSPGLWALRTAPWDPVCPVGPYGPVGPHGPVGCVRGGKGQGGPPALSWTPWPSCSSYTHVSTATLFQSSFPGGTWLRSAQQAPHRGGKDLVTGAETHEGSRSRAYLRGVSVLYHRAGLSERGPPRDRTLAATPHNDVKDNFVVKRAMRGARPPPER